MDAKITKKRLGHQLSYDWIKIAGTCILAVVLLLVLFTTIATRPTAGQTFDFYTFFDVRFNSSRLGSLDTLKEKGAEYTGNSAETDGNIITGRGPGLVFEFGLAVLEYLKGKDAADEVRKGLLL